VKSKVPISGLLLGLLLLAAFSIRLYGLPRSVNPEADFYLGFFRFFYYSPFNLSLLPSGPDLISPQFFIFLAAAAGWVITAIRYAGLALAHINYYQPFSTLMVLTVGGEVLLIRFCSVLMGTLLVFLIYRVGVVFFSRREGWIAALLVALSPFLVNNSRYIGDDTAAAVFVTAGLLFSGLIIKRGELKWYILAGLSAGLAGGLRFAGWSVIPVIILAYLLRLKEVGSADQPRRRFGYLIATIFFLFLGVIISCPAFWYEPAVFLDQLSARFQSHSLVELLPAGSLHQYSISFFHQVRWGMSLKYGAGFLILPLALGGAILGLARKGNGERCLILAALAYTLLAILSTPVPCPADLLPMALMAFLLAARFLIFLISLLRSKTRVRDGAVVVLVCLIIFPFLLVDLKVIYLSRAKDTISLARDWIRENISPGSRVRPAAFAAALPPAGPIRSGGGDYLVLEESSGGSSPGLVSLEETSDPGKGETDLSLPQKVFRTESVDFINPVIKIYNLNRQDPAWEWKSLILRDLDFDYSETSPEILVLEEDMGYEGKTGFWVGSYEVVRRLILAPRRLERIGVELYPIHVPARVKVKAGRKSRDMTLVSLEPELCLFRARVSFPLLKYSYRVRVKNFEEHPLFVKISASPRRIDRLLHQRGLLKAPEVRLPSPEKLSGLRREMEQAGDDFDRFFERVFSESAAWWREKYSRVYEVEGISPAAAVHLPPVPFRARFRLQAGPLAPKGPMGEIQVCRAEGAEEVIARREISGEDLPVRDGYSYPEIFFVNKRMSDNLEFKVKGTALTCDRVEVYPDLRNWFRDYLPE